MEDNGEAVALGVHERNRALKLQWDAHVAAAAQAQADGDTHRFAIEDKAQKRVKDDFFRRNYGLGIAASRKYQIAAEKDNREDYIQGAFEAQVKAFHKWDPDKGAFSTFAHMGAEGSVRRTVQQYTKPNTSYGDYCSTPAVLFAEAKLRASNGLTPTDAEVAEVTGLSVGIVERVRRPQPVSLDTPVGDGDQTRGDLVADSHGDDFPFAEVLDLAGVEEEEVLDALRLLPPTQRMVVARRNGVDGAPTQTYTEIGGAFDLSRETVRRAEGKAQEVLLARLG